MKALNTTFEEVSLKATVQITVTRDGQEAIITQEKSIVINGMPDLTGSQIEGSTLVCENSIGDYFYSATDFTSYSWSVVNAALTGEGNKSSEEVSFVGSDRSKQVKLAVTIGEDVAGIVCTATDDTL